VRGGRNFPLLDYGLFVIKMAQNSNEAAYGRAMCPLL
jgi:hypothetical protein